MPGGKVKREERGKGERVALTLVRTLSIFIILLRK